MSLSWMVLTAEILEHNETFCYYFLMFWQKFSLCPQISAVSTIQQDSIWLLWNTKQRGHFLKIFVFFARKTFLEALWDNAKYCECQIGWTFHFRIFEDLVMVPEATPRISIFCHFCWFFRRSTPKAKRLKNMKKT